MPHPYSLLELDAIQEMGNIGSGHAATSLSVLLNNQQIGLHLDGVEMVTLKDCEERFGISPEGVGSFSVVQQMVGDLNGYFWFVVARNDVAMLSEMVAGEQLKMAPEDVVEEVSNILGGSYLRVLSEMMQMDLMIRPPWRHPLRSVLTTNETNTLEQGGVMLIRSQLAVDEREIQCFLSLVLDKASMNRILQSLGLSVEESSC